MAKTMARQYVFTPGAANTGTIVVPGRIVLEQLLVITNTTDNVIIYNFADTAYAGTTVTFTAGNTTTYPTLTQREDGYTTITLGISTVGQSSGDKLQIFFEESYDGVKIRPWDFGTDAIERMRVSNPESLIDADFEYGLQPTKWAGYGLMRGYPSIYEFPGVDLTVTALTTDYQISLGRRRGHFAHFMKAYAASYQFYTRPITQFEIQQNFEALRGRYGI
jgi:hypothetical protein